MLRKLVFICCLIPVIIYGQSNTEDSTVVKKLLDEAYSYEAKEPKKALSIYKKAFQLSNKIDFPTGAFKATMYSGIVHSDMSNYDSAIYYYEKALPLSDLAKDVRGKGVTYINIGNVYQFKGDLEKAPEYYLKSIEFLEQAQDNNALANTYINLSSLFGSLNQPDKQIEYLNQGIEKITPENPELLGISLGDLGLAYLYKEQFEKAFGYFRQQDSVSKTGDFPRLNFFSQRNFGEYYYYTSSFREAISFYESALKLGEEINDQYFETDLLLNLSNSHIQLKNYEVAISNLTKALSMAEKSGATEIKTKALLYLAKAHSLKGAPESLKFYEQHKNLKDSLYNIEKVKAINELETKYEAERKDKEIAEQQLALQKSKSRTSILSIITVSALAGILLVLFSFRQRQKRKDQEILALKREHQVKTLESLIEGEEKERHRIAQELHDGVNGDLSAIKFKLSTLLDTNSKTIEEAMNMIDRSCEQVRAISHNLIPPSLEDFNLIEALYEFTEKMNNLHPIDISFFHIGEMIEVSKKSELNIFRIIQELVGNSIKHSEGSEINVQLSTINEMIQISVEDDGKGFDTEATSSGGIGLKNIQSRVDYLNATIDVDSTDKGTSYVIEILKNTLDDN
ncbi:tetratricopeptide repeat-containing sensor histidine kinase [Spongiivirga citrea]|uniref:histidine kinase n=1 Tax=Spongiivirga citrea TaxID=1481457 RepID=A0A6M0CIF3_9FLAO|nr:tetratricopeptide repeat protein [Spongiivirga citrea]NER17746.1 tetratricopeptide repeat protein [Spongiivirga citrea]